MPAQIEPAPNPHPSIRESQGPGSICRCISTSSSSVGMCISRSFVNISGPCPFNPQSARQVNSGERRQPFRCHDTSALNYDALWRFCAIDFSASGQKRRLCRRSTRTLMANLPFQSHHRYAISLSFPTTQVCYRVQSKDVRFHFGFISCWSARSQCVRLARPTRCSSSPARPVY